MGTALTKLLDSSHSHAIETVTIGPDKNLYIYYQQCGSEQKYMNISNEFTWPWLFPKYPNLPNILVPQEAYKFVAAMDEVIRQLPVEETKHSESDEKPLVLATQEVTGDRHYDFKLSAWHQKDGGCNFEILGVPNSEEHQEKSLYCPCFALPELRQKMVKILVEHDGSERIDKMPKIPEWATPTNDVAGCRLCYNHVMLVGNDAKV